jgi:hypothetical protein
LAIPGNLAANRVRSQRRDLGAFFGQHAANVEKFVGIRQGLIHRLLG